MYGREKHTAPTPGDLGEGQEEDGLTFVYYISKHDFTKVAAWCAMSAVISCIVITVLMSIGLGVGVGYNYAYVDMKTQKLEGMAAYEARAKEINPQGVQPFGGSSNVTKAKTTKQKSKSRPKILRDSSLPDDPSIPDFPSIPDASSVPDISLMPTTPTVPRVPSIPETPSITLGIPSIPSDNVRATEPVLQSIANVRPKPDSHPKAVTTSGIAAKKYEKVSVKESLNDTDLPTDYESRIPAVPSYGFGDQSDGIDDAVLEFQRRKAYNRRTKPPVPRNKQKKATSSIAAMPTILIPLQGHPNLSPLISKILEQKKNVTLQFITL